MDSTLPTPALLWLPLQAMALLFGALWGSFCNVCIVRIPRGEQVVRGRSRCVACGTPIRFYDNIPLVSFLLLRGRCRRCGERFSLRYPLVELVVAVLSLLVYRHAVAVGGAPGVIVARYLIELAFVATLVVLSSIDLDTMTLPDTITYPAIPMCVLLSLLLPEVRLRDALIGALAGYLAVRVLSDGYYLVTRREGLGYGDGKLLAMVGGLLGWQALPFALMLGSLQGSFVSLAILGVLRRRQRATTGAGGASRSAASEIPAGAALPTNVGLLCTTPLRHLPVPFGPFISLGAIEYLLFAEPLRQTFLFGL